MFSGQGRQAREAVQLSNNRHVEEERKREGEKEGERNGKEEKRGCERDRKITTTWATSAAAAAAAEGQQRNKR